MAHRHPDLQKRLTEVVMAVSAPNGYKIRERMSKSVPIRSNTATSHASINSGGSAASSHVWSTGYIQKPHLGENEIDENPEKRFNHKLVWSMALALLAQVAGCLTLQISLPGPVAIFPAVATGDDSTPLFMSHLLSTYIILLLYLMCFTPVFLNLLLDMKDANGIRFDIMSTLCLSIPLLFIWMILIILINTGVLPQTPLCGMLIEFMPTLLYLCSHITSIVLPLAWTHRAYAVVPFESGSKFDMFGKAFRSNYCPKERKRGEYRKAMIPLNLTIEDFSRVMNDPELYIKFKRFAARDFSMECIMLHEAHLTLKILFEVLMEAGEVPRNGIVTTQPHQLKNLATSTSLSEPNLTIGRIHHVANPRSSMIRDGGMFEPVPTEEPMPKRYSTINTEPRRKPSPKSDSSSSSPPHSTPPTSHSNSSHATMNSHHDSEFTIVNTMSLPRSILTLDWDNMNAPGWAVVSHSQHIWDAFLKPNAPIAVPSVSADSRRSVEVNLSKGMYTMEMFDAIEQQNQDIMYWEIYPKFMRAYNLDKLEYYGIK
ncbi:hypothetical protein HDU97_001253 [Phlyctochytrium planicorne]|nr:hypothetical protein HDU97_001253 [Phlyctochytrium planicorne]